MPRPTSPLHPLLALLAARPGFRGGALPWTFDCIILRHDWETRGLPHHFDLLLDDADRCATWWSAVDPSGASGPFDLHPQADHRRAYMTYEGIVGGGRGTVSRVAEGKATIDVVGGAVMTHMTFARAGGERVQLRWRITGQHDRARTLHVERLIDASGPRSVG